MPYANIYIPATNRDRFNLIRQKEKQSRVKHYEEALKYFHTDVKDYSVNLVKLCADRTVQFLFNSIPSIKSDLPEFDDIINKYFSNLGLGFFNKLALRGFLMGNTYLRVTQDDDGVKFILVNPSSVLHYVNDNDSVLWYEISTIKDDYYYIEDCVSTPRGWVVYTYKSTHKYNADFPVDFTSGSAFELVSEITFPRDILPLIAINHLPSPDGIYGRHEVDQKALLTDINTLLTQISDISALNSNPLDVITGADIADVKQGADILTISSPTANVKRLEMQPNNLKPLMDTLTEKIKIYLSIARVILLSGELQDLQRVTNTGIKILFSDMLSKNNILRDSYERGLREIVKVIALTNGYRVPQYKLIFSEPLPVDMTELVSINTALYEIGARSLSTIMRSMGDDPVIEFANIQQEKQLTQTGIIN